MPRKKSTAPPKPKSKTDHEDAYIAGAGIVAEEKISETLVKNYMPYAMSVIVSRALPEIDGFKPAHRKLLYTMYKMGLLTGSLTKSANVVGQTMRLNPHGDAAIYDTLVRLSRGNETLLHPYVQSKGNFGKNYSREMAYAAARYTEVKLEPICQEIFGDIEKNTVDFIPNYDNTMQEPSLLPAAFPSILVNANVGIAVSMASSIPPFHLGEICDTAIALIQNPNHDVATTLQGPDFPGGGYLCHDVESLRKIYETGRGSVKLRAKWNYVREARCIEITEIPYSTTIEAIIDKIIEGIKNGKLREISYVRDETDRNGLKIAIDLKRGSDPEAVVQKLFQYTPLQDSFSCNFNLLIGTTPRVLGVRDILKEWIQFRTNCVRRRLEFDLSKKQERYHLCEGLSKILLDIDRAIQIVRETASESEVVDALCQGFQLDPTQAEYVAEIKFRHFNREYMMARTAEMDTLTRDIETLQDILAHEKKIQRIIVDELKEIKKRYGQPRRTQLLAASEFESAPSKEEIPDTPVHVFMTRGGYFKKILPASLRQNSDQKVKEDDEIVFHMETTNRAELLFFTNQQQVYKTRASEFSETKPGQLGDYIPAKLGFEEGESVVRLVVTTDYRGELLFAFENGKIARVPLQAYATKTNRRKLQNAYSDKSKIVGVLPLPSDELKRYLYLKSDKNAAVLVNPEMIPQKSTRDTQGVQVMTLKSGGHLSEIRLLTDDDAMIHGVRHARSIPAVGSKIQEAEQLTLF